MSNAEYKRCGGIFWRQAITWTQSFLPEVSSLREGNPVFETIVKTFQEDKHVTDERSIRYWKMRCDELRNQDSRIRNLHSQIQSLKYEIADYCINSE